ncbi:MAG TPA: hypothetical protein VLT59_16310 [Steroidobacteraceae bacterium]|nr:hypothetical protein [Steroidobacteraceae bacterium]
MLNEVALELHIAFGSFGLVCFWASAALRKGSARHRLTGRLYFIALAVVVGSAVPLTAAAFVDRNRIVGGFLASLILITATTGRSAWRAARNRNSPEHFFDRPYHGLAVANIASGLAMLVVGVLERIPIVAVFAAVGITLGLTMLQRASRQRATGQWSALEAHYANVIGCGVATHIAFLNLGLTRWLPETLQTWVQPIAWLGPLAVAFLVTRWLDARYSRKRAPQRTAAIVEDAA